METNLNKWWQRPQPVWVTILGSTLLVLTILASWQLAHVVLAKPVAVATANNASNQVLPYQGYLTNAQGEPLNGTQTIRLELFNASSGGTRLFGPETHNNVPVTNGLFNLAIGSQTTGGVPSNVWDSTSLYAQVTVNGETLSPREFLILPSARPVGEIPSHQINFPTARAFSTDTIVYTDSETPLKIQDVNITLEESSNLLVFWQAHGGNTAHGGGDFHVYVNGEKMSDLRTIYEMPNDTGLAYRAVMPLNISGVIYNLPAGSHEIAIYAKNRRGGELHINQRLLNVVAIGN